MSTSSYSFDNFDADVDPFEPDFHEAELNQFFDAEDDVAPEVSLDEMAEAILAGSNPVDPIAVPLLDVDDELTLADFNFPSVVEGLTLHDTTACLAELNAYGDPWREAAEREGVRNPKAEFYSVVNKPLFSRRLQLKAEVEALEQLEGTAGLSVGDELDLSRARAAYNAITELIARFNSGLALNYVRRFTSKSSAEDSADFLAAAHLGLVQGMSNFDPELGKFASWAYKPIQREVLRAVHSSDHPNLNPGDFEKRKKVLQARQTLVAALPEGAPSPTYEQISEASGEVVGLVKRVLEAPHLESIHTKVGDDGYSELGDLIPDPRSGFEDSVISSMSVDKLMQFGMSVLTAEERLVLVRVFGLDGEAPAALAEIGEDLGKSREAVRQIRSKAISKLMHPTVLRKILMGDREQSAA